MQHPKCPTFEEPSKKNISILFIYMTFHYYSNVVGATQQNNTRNECRQMAKNLSNTKIFTRRKAILGKERYVLEMTMK